MHVSDAYVSMFLHRVRSAVLFQIYCFKIFSHSITTVFQPNNRIIDRPQQSDPNLQQPLELSYTYRQTDRHKYLLCQENSHYDFALTAVRYQMAPFFRNDELRRLTGQTKLTALLLRRLRQQCVYV